MGRESLISLSSSTAPTSSRSSAVLNMVRKNYLSVLAVGFLCVVVIYVISSYGPGVSSMRFMSSDHGAKNASSASALRGANGALHYDVWPPFSPIVQSHETFRRTCLTHAQFSIARMSELLQNWAKFKNPMCRELFKKFNSIYVVETRQGTVKIPQTFVGKVKGWLGNNEEYFAELFHQNIIHVVNLYTRETTVFNPLRDKRPVTKPKESEEDYLKRITIESAKTCDFCRYRNFTAEHSFGRVETPLSFSASNIFKLDSLHAVITIKAHDPVNWSFEQYMDMMKLTTVWLGKAHSNFPEATYPAIIWDLLPKSGSSQLHPHNQIFLSPHRYQGMVETWRRAAQDYFVATRSNYFTDMVTLYSALGLTVKYKSAVAMASLTPRKDNEVVVMAEEANEDFFKLVYYVLRAFMDDLKKYSFSLGGGFPALGGKSDSGKIPAFVRIITRGVMTEIRTDISALELFTATNVNIDPYKVIAIVQDSVSKRAPREQPSQS